VSLFQEKIQQAGGLLDELSIDLWMIFARESSMQADPAMPIVVGYDVTWPSCFMFTRDRQAIALVGNLDEHNFVSSGRFTEVLTYTQDVRQEIVRLLERIDPKKIAIDYSLSDPAADGLTHGMYLVLLESLEDTPYRERLVSGEVLISKLRSRKLPSEVERLSSAARMGHDVWQAGIPELAVALTEKQVAAILDDLIGQHGGYNAFPSIVNAGDKTKPGHGLPTDAKLAPGDLLHVDFGVSVDGYCSDLQRLVYFRRPGESRPGPELTDAFALVCDIITESAKACLPGVTGYDVDQQARDTLRDHGYPEYQHALGHQLGRSVHDGGAIIGPKWARYGGSPSIPLEVGNVFTLELEIMLPGIGCVGLEEDICITETGGGFLCPRQLELVVK